MTRPMGAGTATEALAELTELVRLARIYRDAAVMERRPGAAQGWEQLANTLDGVRTTLTQEGAGYLEVAWAFVDSGRLTLARTLARQQRRPGAHNMLDVSQLGKANPHV